ncbi:MAG: helix-turn-helix domain-containing protein [Micromonosporaceae bacterium]|nr:helix-turn-helix domain-containing protein [Micromonosporaceae bacterium]
MTLADNVGRALRALREAAGLSLSELARQSGVGKATLSELESGRRNPTLETLYALTTALGVPLSAVLPAPDGGGPAAVVSGQAVDAVLITRFTAAEATTELYRMTIRPGAAQRSAAHTPGTVEHLVVLAGTAVVGGEGRERTVRAGRSYTWPADEPHTYAAKGSAPVDAVLVMTYSPAAPARLSS